MTPPPGPATPLSSGSPGERLAWQPPAVADVAWLLPGYEVLSLLGHGSMGAVYLALQTALDRPVAIKLLPLEISADEEFAQRFVREARAMARLSHPRITPVYDSGKTDAGHLYYVMEFVDGPGLPARIAAGMKPEEALGIAAQVCDALASAHAHGIVHRDIKPANVLLDPEGRVKVADFGIARVPEAGGGGFTLTRAGRYMGTPDYVAPEQSKGAQVDHRADLFSVGVMLYEMLCGEVPRGVFTPPSRRGIGGTRLDALVHKAMQQAPEQRYQTAAEMQAALESVRRSPGKNVSRLPRLLFGLGGVAALTAALLYIRPEKGQSSSPSASAPVTAPPAARPGPTRRETAEWFFRVGDSLSFLNLRKPDGSAIKVESLEQMPEQEYPIVDIWLDHYKSAPGAPPVLPEDFVRHLAGLTQLQSAYFRFHALLRDEHFAFLAANPRLNYLRIEGCPVTDAVLEHIAGLPELNNLALTGSKAFTGQGMDKLACKPSLEILMVMETGFTDASVRGLVAFPRLREAGLGFTSVTDAGLPALRDLRELEYLDLFQTALTDSGITGLASMKRLKKLVVSNAQASTMKALREALPECEFGPTE